MLAGIVGKPNTGKTTFFSAATLAPAKIAPYPFTTIEPNRGVAYLRAPCVCREFNVRDEPRNSMCIDGFRLIPVEVIDVAGLVPDAWKGRGLGNQFLDHLRQADVLIHVVDASGGTDFEGRPCPIGTHDPLEDVRFLERELSMWLFQAIKRDWDRVVKAAEASREDLSLSISKRLSGLSIFRRHVAEALRDCGLEKLKPRSWRDDDLMSFSNAVRERSKPLIIAANKIDIPTAEENIRRMREAFKNRLIIPCCAEAELALRRASERGLINYRPGDSDLEVLRPEALTSKQREGLMRIKRDIFERWGSTGVQEILNAAFFKLLQMISVYPVENPAKLCDHDGRVLPDVFLVPHGTKVREFAYKIHTDLGETFLYAIDARTRSRLGEDHVLKDGAVVTIIAAKGLK